MSKLVCWVHFRIVIRSATLRVSLTGSHKLHFVTAAITAFTYCVGVAAVVDYL